MDFTFLQSSGDVAFFRSDAEQADWTQEELRLDCTFPYNPKKVIERGQVILFQDPATNDWQAYEIRQCLILPGESYQQFTAEDIAVSELTDCHIPGKEEVTDSSVQTVLQGILKDTGWNVGNVAVNPTSSGDIERGSVWQNVSMICQNWNVYIMSRVTVNADGISGRFLDVLSTDGVDRGLRLAVNKNVSDPCVTYDDSELYTALFGYGGTYTEGSGESRATLEYNFSDVEWSKTAKHPAKPKGQKYLEYPEMTALFGRKGKPRFGYYQNTNIKDPNILLQKTWESLKQCCEPKVNITGTVADYKRMGYADVPMRLHDMAIVELEPIGLLMYKQIIKLRVDLLDATKNLPEVGDYIPNIIYINRETEDHATGGGGGRGGRGSTAADLAWSEFDTDLIDNGRQIILNTKHLDEHNNILQQAGMYIDPIDGVLIYADDNENMVGAKFRVLSTEISSEVTARTEQGKELSSKITQTANKISLEVTERKSADKALSGRIDVQAGKIALVVDDNGIRGGSIVLAINGSGSSFEINADHIDINGLVNALAAKNIGCANLTVQNNVDVSGHLSTDSYIYCGSYLWAESLRVGGSSSGATWQNTDVPDYSLSASYGFVYEVGGVQHTISGRVITQTGTKTLHYLGSAPT